VSATGTMAVLPMGARRRSGHALQGHQSPRRPACPAAYSPFRGSALGGAPVSGAARASGPGLDPLEAQAARRRPGSWRSPRCERRTCVACCAAAVDQRALPACQRARRGRWQGPRAQPRRAPDEQTNGTTPCGSAKHRPSWDTLRGAHRGPRPTRPASPFSRSLHAASPPYPSNGSVTRRALLGPYSKT
jgi:hypothetical protein